jgi:hypothetical protein
MGAPPLLEGGSQCTLTVSFVASVSTDIPVGAPGADAAATLGVITEVGSDSSLVPSALAAVTVKVYPVPFARPLTTAYPSRV